MQAQFDLFWVAAQVSIPFVIAGICLGAHGAGQQAGRSRASDSQSSGPPSDAGRVQAVRSARSSAARVDERVDIRWTPLERGRGAD